jgi:hypothetical protein
MSLEEPIQRTRQEQQHDAADPLMTYFLARRQLKPKLKFCELTTPAL